MLSYWFDLSIHVQWSFDSMRCIVTFKFIFVLSMFYFSYRNNSQYEAQIEYSTKCFRSNCRPPDTSRYVLYYKSTVSRYFSLLVHYLLNLLHVYITQAILSLTTSHLLVHYLLNLLHVYITQAILSPATYIYSYITFLISFMYISPKLFFLPLLTSTRTWPSQSPSCIYHPSYPFSRYLHLLVHYLLNLLHVYITQAILSPATSLYSYITFLISFMYISPKLQLPVCISFSALPQIVCTITCI